MAKKKKKSEARRITDLVIYCVAVMMVFFAVVLFMQEYSYVPQEVYSDPPPAAPYTPSSPAQTIAPTVSPTYPYAPPVQSDVPQYTPSSPYPTDTQKPSETPEATASPAGTPKATASPTPIFADDVLHPVKLYFIERKVSCKIRPVGINAKNEMETIRSPYDAGWLYTEPYVLPGDTGKAIIAGHNRWSGHNGTFSVLKKMEVGETVAVEMSDGYARYFRVDELTECAYNDNSIMEPVYDRPVLILITCKGDWDSVLHTSRTRIIAICSPMS